MMNAEKFRSKTCCFTGHREILEADEAALVIWLEEVISQLYLCYGVRYFGSGGAMGFDILAAEVVLRLAEKYPEIKLILVLPCLEHDKFWNRVWKYRLKEIKRKTAKIVYTSDYYHKDCMYVRNRHLVDYSSWCIAYCRKNEGGTAYTVLYAEEKQCRVLYFPAEK